jgi:predicted ATPase
MNTRPSFSSFPMPLTSFIGREQQVQAICALLQRPEVRLLTLTGTGGVGKTRLGLAVANALLEAFADGVYFVPLAPVSDPERVIVTIARALGLWEGADRPLMEQLQVYLQDRHLLLLLDNFEQVVAAAPELADLLAFCPELHLLVTSRAVLHISGEYEFPVAPLAVPDLTQVPEHEVLAQVAAVSLFVQRAQATQPSFTLTRSNAHTIAEICVRLDGLPLAIELATARIKLLPPQALLKRLEHRLTVLTGGARNLPIRQQTLRNTIQWSYDLLSAQEQRLFRQLSVFVGGCTLGAAAAVYSAGTDQAIEIFEEVASLLDKSLLQQTEQEGEEPRLLILETIREYGLECLRERGELEAAQRAHVAYYLALAEEAIGHWSNVEGGKWIERLERDHENLRAALQWALERADAAGETAVRLGLALCRFWGVHGHLSEGRIVLERALAASGRSGAAVRAKALLATFFIAWYQSDYARVEEVCEEALSLCQQLGDQRGIAYAHLGLAGVALHRHHYAAARVLAEEALAGFRGGGDTLQAAFALMALGRVASIQGEYPRANQLFEESLVLYRTLGDPGDMVWPLLYLARIAITEGEPAQAHTRLAEALALSREAGDKRPCSLS